MIVYFLYTWVTLFLFIYQYYLSKIKENMWTFRVLIGKRKGLIWSWKKKTFLWCPGPVRTKNCEQYYKKDVRNLTQFLDMQKIHKICANNLTRQDLHGLLSWSCSDFTINKSIKISFQLYASLEIHTKYNNISL